MSRVILKDLSPGVAYNVQFRARNDDSASAWSRTFIIQAEGDAVAPATPANFGVTLVGTSFYTHWSQVLLSGDGSPCYDADHYRLKIESAGGAVAYKTIRYDHGKQEESDIVEDSLTFTQNRSYFGTAQADLTFSVQAVDRFGNASPFSAEVEAVNPAPASPTNFVVTGGLESLHGTWTAPPDDDLLEYRVYMGTAANFTPTSSNLIYNGSVTQFTLPSTNYNADLWFKLVAVDLFNSESPAVEAGPVQVRSTTGGDATPPDTPTLTNVTMTAGANSASAKATWTVPAGNDDIAGFTLSYRKVDTDPNTSGNQPGDWAFTDSDAESTGTTVENLEFGTAYEFRVRAYDYSFNQSGWSATVGPRSAAPAALPKPATPTVGAAEGVGMQVVQSLSGIPNYATAFEVYVVASAGDTPAGSPAGTIAIFNNSLAQVVGTFQSVSAEGKYVKTRAVSSVAGPSPFSDAAGPVVVGKLDWEFIENVQVVNAQIESVGAEKVIAGQGFVNDLTVKSTFWLGDASTDGVVKSYGYQAGVSGFKIAKSGLEINEGSIAARALNIQFGNNVMPSKYADFEWIPSSYTQIVKTGATAVVTQTTSKYGQQILRITQNSGSTGEVRLTDSTTNYNVPVDASTNYIVSAWVRSGTTPNTYVKIAFNTSPETVSTVQSIAIPAANAWTRLYGLVTVPAGASLAQVVVGTTTVGAVLDVDGVQVERQLTSSSLPSVWTPPSSTTIDGGQIRTGEIRSTSTVMVNGVAQPSWIINLAGGAQLNDLLIRGNAIVGTLDDGSASSIKSANYASQTTGWLIRADGYAEFSGVSIYGGMLSTGHTGGARMTVQNSTDVSGNINSIINLYSGRTLEAAPGEIKSQSNGPLTTDGWFLSMRPPQVASTTTQGFVYARPSIYLFAGDPDSNPQIMIKAAGDVVNDYGGITLTGLYDTQNGYHTDFNVNAYIYAQKGVLLSDGEASKLRGIPFANLWPTGAWSTVSGGGQQPVPLDAGVFNNLTVDYTNQKITITKGGIYLLTLQANTDSASYTGYITGVWRRNGTEPLANTRTPLSGSGYASGTSICALYLAAGEYVWPFVTRPGDTNWRGGSNETYATVSYLGSP